MSRYNKLVSVIIPTKNSAATIESCIASVAASTHEPVEIIVVDALSWDPTPFIAARLGTRLISRRCGVTQARNIGLRAARGDYVLHLDSDMQLSPDTLEDCLSSIETFDALIIPELASGTGFWARCKALEKELYLGVPDIEAPRFFRKSVLLQIEGHSENLTMGEDWDLALRLASRGYRIGRVKSCLFHNEGRLSLRIAVRKKHAYGYTAFRYMRAHPEEFRRQTAIMHRILMVRRNARLIARRPVHALGLGVLKMAEYLAFEAAMQRAGRGANHGS